mmetsp:Transcript_55213/g.61718  ORF Transcript_55213/g.61718 Transcript_55213/m.61718 type:complete len:216 (-) Transcript_55213:526-1173(-)
MSSRSIRRRIKIRRRRRVKDDNKRDPQNLLPNQPDGIPRPSMHMIRPLVILMSLKQMVISRRKYSFVIILSPDDHWCYAIILRPKNCCIFKNPCFCRPETKNGRRKNLVSDPRRIRHAPTKEIVSNTIPLKTWKPIECVKKCPRFLKCMRIIPTRRIFKKFGPIIRVIRCHPLIHQQQPHPHQRQQQQNSQQPIIMIILSIRMRIRQLLIMPPSE